MSRLWPETLTIGLFPGECVLRRGKTVIRRSFTAGSDYAIVLAELDAQLGELQAAFGRFTRADVFVSDSFGRIVLLPWQNKLDSEIQVQAYGQACLESSGAIVDGTWAVHAGFRHHGGVGIASALPAGLVEHLRDVLAARRVRLQSVMPIAAGAYWYHRPSVRKATSVLLLAEHSRLTALVHVNGNVKAMDVEPLPKQASAAAQRLFIRLRLSQTDIRRIDYWAASPDEDALETVRSNFDGTVVGGLDRARWSVG